MRAMRLAVSVRAWTFAAMTLAVLVPAGTARALLSANPHVTDGVFTGPQEWDTTRTTVTEFTFPVVGNTGGANLFVEQAGGVLYLMYDYTNSAALHLTPANATFDVFFQVPNDQPGGTDYVVSFTNSTFSAFEKPTTGPASPLNPDGSFNLNSPVWTALSSDDLARAGFASAVGFGHDPATPSVPDHLLAEFQLTIQTASNPDGFYDPSPAFWSASASGGGLGVADPPISSAIFQLNPDGTTIVVPVLGPNGGPVLQPQDAVTPEPSSVALVGVGVAILAVARRRRRVEA